ncbi:Cinnamoyl-CoA reductase 1 [Linum perenne]
MSTTKHAVCVTGAGGFLGSWVVRLLLSKEYSVHGTVRDPTDDKYAHLKQLPKASTNLKLVKADLLDYPSLVSAFQGCSGVFHVASPVPAFSVSNPQVELLEPAVTGTRNVVKACVETQVNRAVVVSSGAAVSMNPNWPKDKPMDESCWSDKEYCKTTEVLCNIILAHVNVMPFFWLIPMLVFTLLSLIAQARRCFICPFTELVLRLQDRS